MIEDGKRNIDKKLENDAQRQKDLWETQQNIYERLRALAEKTGEQFVRDEELLEPVAAKKLEQTIKPWWLEFEESGRRQKLQDWVNTRQVGTLTISKSVIYPDAPEETVWRESSLVVGALRRADQETARNMEAFYTKSASEEYLSEAFMMIRGEPFDLPETYGFKLAIWPVIGKNQAVAMSAHTREILLQYDDADKLFYRIHPEVLIGISEQIETGNIWKTIEESMQRVSSRRTVQNAISGAVIRERDQKRAEEYRRTKAERYARYLSQ